MVCVFKKHQFLLGVSVDGTAVIHNRHRHDTAGSPTYERIKENLRLLLIPYEVEYNILTVVNTPGSGKYKRNLPGIQKNGWNFQQYIACLDPLGEEPGKQEYSPPKTMENFSPNFSSIGKGLEKRASSLYPSV